MCKKNSAEVNYTQLFTIRTEPVDVLAKVTILGQTLKIDVEELDLKFEKIYNSSIGEISDGTFNTLLTVLQPIIRVAINTVTNTEGIDLNSILSLVGLTWLGFGPT